MMSAKQIYLGLLAYALTSLAMVGLFMLLRFKFDPIMILTGLALWPDISLLAGLGRMTKAQNTACRIAGLAFAAAVIYGRYH